MLFFENVSKQFSDETLALNKINLTINQGEFCVLLGPSGAGKSTLLRITNGLIEPTEGRFYFDDIALSRRTLRNIQRRTAMVHQQFHLTPRLTVLQNVLCGSLPQIPLFLSLLKVFPVEYQQKACTLLHQVGLSEEHLYRRTMNLSGGQQQRVAMARAFMLDPDVVLADEPVASLDPKISVDILDLLKQSSKKIGATVLCSLHQVNLAKQFADRIVGMNNGEIVFDGKPDELKEINYVKIYGAEDADQYGSADVVPQKNTPTLKNEEVYLI